MAEREPGRTAAEAQAVIMPQLDMTTEEMTILRWMKDEGDHIEQGDALLEVMTEKIAIEIDASFTGYVRGIRYEPDAVVPVGEVIAYITAGADDPLPGAGESSETTVADGARQSSEPTVQQSAGSDGASQEADRATADKQPLQAADIGPVRAAPIVRRIAADLKVNLTRITGTGPGGRVLADDVRAFAAGEAKTSSADVIGGVALAPTARGAADAAVVESRLSPTRRAIASRMAASWQSAPHVTLTIDVDMSAAAAFRSHVREALAAEGREVAFTWNSLIAWVAVQALVRQPELNATLEGDVLRRYGDIHLGVAVDTPGGLLVPVVRETQRLGAAALANALNEAAAKAMDGRLQPADLSEGTFTITNLGGFGIGSFTPILNPPQVAILGVGAVQDQVLPVDGKPEIRPVCTFSLSFDHRAADGADGARYLALLKQLLLNPHRLVV